MSRVMGGFWREGEVEMASQEEGFEFIELVEMENFIWFSSKNIIWDLNFYGRN